MSCVLQLARSSHALRAAHQLRRASTLPSSSSAVTSQKRLDLDVQVDPNHGLWAFFRKKEVDGVVKHETVETIESLTESGRPWRAGELRRKSFKDLHTLWYVLLRERNLLATQKEEARRLGVASKEALAAPTMDTMCRKSMARIKGVLNERRLHYEKLFAQGAMPQEEILKVPEPPSRRMTRRERTAARRKAASASSGTPTDA